MKATRLDVLHKCTVPLIPVENQDAVPKVYVDLNVAGGIFITAVTPTVNSGNNVTGFFTHLADTVPENALVTEATTNTASIRVHFLAEPKNTLFGITVLAEWEDGVKSQIAQSVEQSSNDARVYTGYVDILLDDTLLTDTVKLISSTGAEAIVDLNLLIGGPEVTSATLGSLPGGQTALKDGDQIAINGTVENTASGIEVLDFGVSTAKHSLALGAEDSAGAGFRTFSGTLTASNRTGTLSARVVAVNLLGTEGVAFDSTTALLDQVKPTVGNASYTYPAGQLAIKASESVTLDIAITNADGVDYSVASGLSVANPTLLEASKVITRADETIQYSFDADLLTVTATKSANGSITVKNFIVDVVNVAATATLSFLGNPARLRTDADGEQYTLQVSPSQPLIGAPTNLVAAPSAGTFTGNWSQSSINYRHGFTVYDIDARGVHNFSTLEITGLSGIVSSTITSGEAYTIGGFLARIITMPALQQYTDIGTFVLDFNKVRAQYVGADELVRQVDLSQVTKAFTIVDSAGNLDNNGNNIFLNDGNFAGTNTTGTLQIEVEELA